MKHTKIARNQELAAVAATKKPRRKTTWKEIMTPEFKEMAKSRRLG